MHNILSQHIFLLAVPHQQRINVAIFFSSSSKEGDKNSQLHAAIESRQELVDQFQNWEPEILQILEVIDFYVYII